MKDYNYLEAMEEDVLRYIRDEIDLSEFDSLEELEGYLKDTLWTADSVTGNGSGSYTFNSYQAEENICHNLDLLAEALEEFGGGCDILKDGAEAADVTIRCYLLEQAIAEALEEIEDDFDEAHPAEESKEK